MAITDYKEAKFSEPTSVHKSIENYRSNAWQYYNLGEHQPFNPFTAMSNSVVITEAFLNCTTLHILDTFYQNDVDENIDILVKPHYTNQFTAQATVKINNTPPKIFID
jgi:hypothetical protein